MSASPISIWKAVLLLLAFLTVPCACGNETAGETLEFETAFMGTISSGSRYEPFENERGWRITLQKAAMAVGPVYFYSSEAQAQLWRGLFEIKSAWACPAHAQFDRGRVLGEIRRQYVVDPMPETPTSGGVSRGEKGRCRMFELHFHPPGQIPAASDAAAFAALEGHSFFIRGLAEKDGVGIDFEGFLSIPDLGSMRIVESIPADLELDERQGKALILIYVDRQMSNMDFGSIIDESGACIEAAPDGVCRIGDDSQAYLAWLSGVKSRSSYALEWRE